MCNIAIICVGANSWISLTEFVKGLLKYLQFTYTHFTNLLYEIIYSIRVIVVYEVLCIATRVVHFINIVKLDFFSFFYTVFYKLFLS